MHRIVEASSRCLELCRHGSIKTRWERQETDLVRRLHGGSEGCAWYMVGRRVVPGMGWKRGLRLGGGGKGFALGMRCSVIKRDFAI